jgi:TrmH family RNA methyltransferase
LRTADWFGFKTIVLSEGSVEFTNPKVVKSSMGSIFHLNIFDEVNLKSFISLSKKNEYKIFGTSTSGKNFLNQKIQLKSVLIFGNESRGISKEITELCDELIKIPSLGSAESLNLAISTSIFFYELKRDELKD